MKRLCFAALLFLSSPTFADNDNLQFCIPTAVMIAVDVGQAVDLRGRADVREANALLGPNATPAQFAAYGLAASAAVCGIGAHLSKENRRLFYGFVMGLEGGMIWTQFQLK